LEEVQGEHGDLLVLAVGAGQLAGLAVAEDRIRAVPVLDYLEAFVDLPSERDQAQVVGHLLQLAGASSALQELVL
jgi:hypothetical protein